MAESKGLPMTVGQVGPEQIQREEAELDALARKPFLPRAAGYIKRTGPGLLQAAMTLGVRVLPPPRSSPAPSFGYKLLWVQPLAMFLGDAQCAGQHRPFDRRSALQGLRPRNEQAARLSGPWARSSLRSSGTFQYAGCCRARPGPDGRGIESFDAQQQYTTAGRIVSFGVGGLILGINLFTVFSYGSSTKESVAEWFLAERDRSIMLMFATS